MKNFKPSFLLILALLIVGIVFATRYSSPNSEYKTIKENTSKVDVNNEAYNKMMDVLTHQRCVNCHPNDNIPKQSEDSHPHYFDMARGEANMGFDATKCTTCHQTENNNFSGVPGAPEWSLAPHKMRWEGLSRSEIAKSILNKENNGNRNHEELIHHLTEHALVLWAWSPGVDGEGNPREKPPIPLKEYKEAVYEWFENGAIVPEEKTTD